MSKVKTINEVEHIVRVDYQKYDSENEDYYYDKSPHFSEIWMCNLPTKSGSVQSGYRPVYILSNDQNNTHSTTLNIIPITSKTRKKALPIHVKLWNYQSYGLKTPSTMLIEQIMTIPFENLDKCVGKVSDSKTLNDISRALAIQFPVLSTIKTL